MKIAGHVDTLDFACRLALTMVRIGIANCINARSPEMVVPAGIGKIDSRKEKGEKMKEEKLTTKKFERLKLWATRSGICPVCGNRVQRSKVFWATMNPYNKNADGTIKTRAEIYEELGAKKRAWEAARPVYHKKCERQ